MSCRRERHRRTVASVTVALALAVALFGRGTGPASAFDGCTLGDEVRGTTCRLHDGETVEGALTEDVRSATYRVDAFSPDAVLELTLIAKHGSTKVSVVDWRGHALGSAVRGDDAPETRLSVKLPLPGAYGIRVSGDLYPENPGYRLTTRLTYPTPAAQALWPPSLLSPDGPLNSERRLIRVPRGGTPTGGVAAGRTLGAPPDAIFSDFTLVADVQFEQIVGPSALTVRFRYEPEAGGGTGYILSLDPFGGTVTLDSFEEGQRRPIVAHVPLPGMPTSDAPNRLILTADGPSIRATLDGQPLLDVSDARFGKGLIAVGVVTWSDPVAATFDHVQVSSIAR